MVGRHRAAVVLVAFLSVIAAVNGGGELQRTTAVVLSLRGRNVRCTLYMLGGIINNITPSLHQLRAIIVTMALFMVTATISSQSGHSSVHEMRADAAIIVNCQHMVCGGQIARSMPTSSLQVY